MSKYLFDLLFNENNPHGFHASVSRWSTSLILLNLVAMVLETGEGFAASYASQLSMCCGGLLHLLILNFHRHVLHGFGM
jgi:hypothetical protein